MPNVTKSPWIMHYDGTSCNGCDIEVLACLTPLYDVERFGVINTGNPKHADILLITGSVNHQNAPVVRQIYEQMNEPKVVCAIGGVRLQRRRIQGLLQCAGRGGQSDPRRYLCARVRRAAGEYY